MGTGTAKTLSSHNTSENAASPSASHQSTEKKSNAATGASAAGVRAISARMVAFYFRAPAKAFFRNRVDYLAFAKAINPRVQANESWSWRMSTPGLLGHAVQAHGWSFIPNQVVPPLLANVAVGTVLYTSYLQVLGVLHHPSSEATKRIYPPPPIASTLTAGLLAGSIQALIAAPLDALQSRFHAPDLISGKYKNMWQYSTLTLHQIGLRGIFSNFGLTLTKDAIGYSVFFATFEYVKAQAFYSCVTSFYHHLPIPHPPNTDPTKQTTPPTIRPHFTLEPLFLLLAGIIASIAQQSIQYPLTRLRQTHQRYPSSLRLLYRGFLPNTLKQIPSTSAGLVIFELVRRMYADESEGVRIRRDGMEILLT